MTQPLAFQELAAAAQAARPEVAMVLGSGLSDVARRLECARSVPFADVPGLGATSVAGHRGCITLGEWAGKRILIFEGRLHYYEGHPWRNVTLPGAVRVRASQRSPPWMSRWTIKPGPLSG